MTPTMTHPPAPIPAERVFLGLPAEVRQARSWVHALLSASLAEVHAQIRDVCYLVVSELATNAVMHSASGDPGGKFAVLVVIVTTPTTQEVTLHVRDAGPTLRDDTVYRASDDGRGHGLNLVAELADSVGRHTGSECASHRDKDDPTAAGHCTWARFLIPVAAALEVPHARR